MAVYPVVQPLWVADGGTTGPRIQQYVPQPGASFFAGDILISTGSVTNPTPVGALITTAGPALGATQATQPAPFNLATASSSVTQGALTVTATASGATGAPALQYFAVVSYSNTGDTSESLPSLPFIVNVAPGLLPVFNVASAGQPSGSSFFRVYLSTLPNSYWLQGSTTATGSTVTPAYPLANTFGVNKAAAAQSTGIIGMADEQSAAVYYGGVGPGGGIRSIIGPTQSVPPGWDYFALTVPVLKLQNGQAQMSLKQGWQYSLLGASVGINIDANTGIFIVDTTQTACAVIVEKPFGPTLGDVGDTYSRVNVKFNGSALS